MNWEPLGPLDFHHPAPPPQGSGRKHNRAPSEMRRASAAWSHVTPGFLLVLAVLAPVASLALSTPRSYAEGQGQGFLVEYSVPDCSEGLPASGEAESFYTPFLGAVDEFGLYSSLPCPAEEQPAGRGAETRGGARAQASTCLSSLVFGRMGGVSGSDLRTCLERVTMRILTPLEAVYEANVTLAGTDAAEGGFGGDPKLLADCPEEVLEYARAIPDIGSIDGKVLSVILTQRLDGSAEGEGLISIPLLASSERIPLLREDLGPEGTGQARLLQVSEPVLLVRMSRGVIKYQPEPFFCRGVGAAPGGSREEREESELQRLLRLEAVVQASRVACDPPGPEPEPEPNPEPSPNPDPEPTPGPEPTPNPEPSPASFLRRSSPAHTRLSAGSGTGPFETSVFFDRRDSCSACDGCVPGGEDGLCAAELDAEACGPGSRERCCLETILQLAWVGDDAAGKPLVSEGQTLHNYRQFTFWTKWPSAYDKVREELDARSQG